MQCFAVLRFAARFLCKHGGKLSNGKQPERRRARGQGVSAEGRPLLQVLQESCGVEVSPRPRQARRIPNVATLKQVLIDARRRANAGGTELGGGHERI